jgi:hypothetical protein
MRIVTWTIRLVVFVLLVAFAAKNVEPVALRFYFGVELKARSCASAWRFRFSGNRPSRRPRP